MPFRKSIVKLIRRLNGTSDATVPPESVNTPSSTSWNTGTSESPIATLSDGLLRRIFTTLAEPFDSDHAKMDLAVTRPPVRMNYEKVYMRYSLALVCSRWHTIMCDTPALWSTIVLDNFTMWASEELDRCLRWSKSRPLDVFIRPRLPNKPLPHITPYLLLLKKEERRIRTLISSYLYHDELLVLFPIGQGLVSQYRSLTVLHLPGFQSAILQGPPMGNVFTPNLRYLHVTDAIIFDYLTAQLLPLRFLDVWESIFAMPVACFVDFIKKCPQIAYIRLAMNQDFYGKVSWPEARISLPLLRHIDFKSYAGPNPLLFLRSLHMPALETFDFSELTDDPNAVSIDPTFKQQLLWYFLPETSATLKKLDLHESCLPIGDNIVEPLLFKMMNVVELSFVNVEVKRSFLELLIPPANNPEKVWVMPCLGYLRLAQTDIEGDTLFRVIRCRAPSDAEINIMKGDRNDGLTVILKRNPLFRKILCTVHIWGCAVLEDATLSEWLAIKITHSTILRGSDLHTSY